jgi:elongation factor G
LFVVEGNKRTPVNELVAGDVGATLKLRNTHVNNTLHIKGKNVNLTRLCFLPNMTMAGDQSIKAMKKNLRKHFILCVKKINLIVEVSPELHQTLIRCRRYAPCRS